MSVEGGSVGVGVAGGEIGLANISMPGVEFGPSIGIGPIISEGPTLPSFSLESNMPFQVTIFNPIAEAARAEPLIRSAELIPSVIQQAEKVAEEAWLPDTSIATIVAIYGQSEAFGLLAPEVPPPFSEPALAVKKAVVTQTIIQPQTETRVSTPAVEVAPSLQEQAAEEAVEEIELQPQDAEIRDEESEKISEDKIQRIADEPVIGQRVSEIIEAAKKADSLDGEDIIKFLPGQHQKNRSGELNIVDPEGRLIDGSLLALVRKIATFKFTSLIEVYRKAPKMVRENIPVTQGEGRSVSDQDVSKVYEPNKRPAPPAQQVIRRVIKMLKTVKMVRINQQPVQIVPIEEKVTQTNEGTIQDLGLAEVFSTGLTDSVSLS